MFFIRDMKKLKFHIFFWVTCFFRIISCCVEFFNLGTMGSDLSTREYYLSYYDFDIGAFISFMAWAEVLAIIILILLTILLRSLIKFAWVLVMILSGTVISLSIIQIVVYSYLDSLNGSVLGQCVGPILFYTYVCIYYIRRKKIFDDNREYFLPESFYGRKERSELELTQAVADWCSMSEKANVMAFSDNYQKAIEVVNRTKNVMVGRNYSLYQLLLANPELVREKELINIKADDADEKTIVWDKNDTSKFCRFCGEKLPQDSLFCQYCGKEIVTDLNCKNSVGYNSSVPIYIETVGHEEPKTKKKSSSQSFNNMIALWIVFAVCVIISIVTLFWEELIIGSVLHIITAFICFVFAIINSVRYSHEKKKQRIAGIIIAIVLGSISLAVVTPIAVITSIFAYCETQEEKDSFNDAYKSVVRVACFDKNGKRISYGVGVIYKEDDCVVTLYDLVENAYKINCITYDDEVYSVDGAYWHDSKNNIVALKCTGITQSNSTPIKRVNRGTKLEENTVFCDPIRESDKHYINCTMYQYDEYLWVKINTISTLNNGAVALDYDGRLVGLLQKQKISNKNCYVLNVEKIDLLWPKVYGNTENNLKKITTK